VQIDEWFAEGIVQLPISNYVSPIVLVWKKDELTKLCMDYLLLNKKILKDPLPLPLIQFLTTSRKASSIGSKVGALSVPVFAFR